MANIILKYHKGGKLSIQEAQERFEELRKLSETIRILDFKKFSEQAFKLAIATNLTVYDFLYIVSSRKLVTSDVKQADITKLYGRKVVLI
ncbi:MAG: type II toxin-antitoxin system VapC family toxin [Thaumarchaeota archaeon]|nr:type II toxin-antitoxin system VapC family toxin [Candidatus Geocrenenecus arthurdayi]